MACHLNVRENGKEMVMAMVDERNGREEAEVGLQ